MKITGIVLLIFAALNFIVTIAAAGSGASGAAGQKISATLLLLILGGILYYFGKSKENKRKEEERIAKEKEEMARKQKEQAEAKRKAELLERKKQEEADRKHRALKEFEENSQKYKILNFHLDCSHFREQEEELRKCPLALPVELVDVDEDEDIVEKYKVRSLPKLILVDYNGKEIKRWVGVTSGSEINNFLFENGFAEKTDDVPVAEDNQLDININDDDDCEDYPKPMFQLTADDMKLLMSEEYMSKCLSIAAKGGTKEQTQVKFEVLLGKREKTEAMLAIEEPIREFFRKLYGDAAKSAYESSDKPLLRKLTITTNMMNAYKSVNDEDGEFHKTKEQMTAIANKFGVSINLIEDEEKESATNKYSKNQKL